MKVDTPPREMKVDTLPPRGMRDDGAVQVDKPSAEALTTNIPSPTTKRRTESTEFSSEGRSSDEVPPSKKQARHRN
jgi:hypothetical protein